MASPPRIIKLNVGGHTFATARSTLEAQSTYFQRLLSSQFTDLDASGEAFIDRDPRYFHLILNFLRSGMVESPTPPLTCEGLLAEAEYFGIESLASALRSSGDEEDAANVNPLLRADGTGIYVWEDKQQPGLIEAVIFEAAPAAADPGEEPTKGTLIYSRGPCARENLLALRTMPKPLPRVWRDSADASTIVAFFTQRFISRGAWEVDGRALLLSRGTLGSDNAGGATAAAQSTVSTVGVLLLSGEELLLLGPDGAQGSGGSSLLEQLGLQSWRDAGLANVSAAANAERSVGGLGGGFKRFLWEPHASPAPSVATRAGRDVEVVDAAEDAAEP